eukprot:9499607-Pyramimonas_sp.AAC.1
MVLLSDWSLSSGANKTSHHCDNPSQFMKLLKGKRARTTTRRVVEKTDRRQRNKESGLPIAQAQFRAPTTALQDEGSDFTLLIT